MSSLWLGVPLADYEAHMSAPTVDQLGPLAGLFRQTLTLTQPRSVAVLGVAGGNGLDAIDAGITQRVVGVDIHGGYLDAVASRYPDLPGLELHCADLTAEPLAVEPVELVHAALLFEHTGLFPNCLDNAARLVAPGGRMSVVLQLASEAVAAVSPTPYVAVQNLRSAFQLIDPGRLVDELKERGFLLEFEFRQPVASGKGLWLGVFAQRIRLEG